MSETQDMAPVERADLEQSSLGDTEFERELLSEFLSSSSTMLSSLAGAVASSDPTQVMQAAHSLKGCSWTVGARAGRGVRAARARGEGRQRRARRRAARAHPAPAAPGRRLRPRELVPLTAG